MQIAAQRPFELVSFSQQFLLACGVVLVASFVAMGSWLGRQIEQSELNRAALTASVYMESIVAAQFSEWSTTGVIREPTHAMLDRIFVNGPLARKVVRFKLWDRSGHILYSNDHDQVGKTFTVTPRLAEAFDGQMRAEITNLAAADNQPERDRWERLLEIYVPLHSGPGQKVTSVMEFYHSMDSIDAEIRSAQRKTWGLMLLGAALIYALLYGLVRRANNTIVAQQRDLRDQLARQNATLGENETMRERLKDASAHMTAMNEQSLRRTAADLHDGPAQELAFALLRFDDLKQGCARCGQSTAQAELELVHGALHSSLDELRAIAGGLGVPGIERLNLADTLRRAVRDVERRTTGSIAAEIDPALGEAPLAVKITAYRFVHEALTNARRHAPTNLPRLGAQRQGETLLIEVADEGPGFDPQAADSGRLGLAFMRERVRLVGGRFEIDTAPGRGTIIRAHIPLTEEKQIDHG
jgi:signal transduction histidine kinase